MDAIQGFFYLLGLVLFVLAGCNAPVPRVSLGWLGAASVLIGAVFVPWLN